MQFKHVLTPHRAYYSTEFNKWIRKDDKAIREVIKDLSNLTGKEVSKEKEDKIVNTILKNNVPKNIDNFF